VSVQPVTTFGVTHSNMHMGIGRVARVSVPQYPPAGPVFRLDLLRLNFNILKTPSR